MAGRSRSVLNKIGNLHADYVRNRREIVKQYAADNSRDKTSSLREIHAMQQKLTAEIVTLLQDHITFLAKPDPYQREQTFEQAQLSSYKLAGFKSLLEDVQTIIQISKKDQAGGDTFIDDFFRKLDTLKSNPNIDAPRFPPLSMHSLYKFFKTMVTPFYADTSPGKNPAAKSQHTPKTVSHGKKNQ